ncbi:putative lipopolysaccharide heptosyltransferase III [Proteus vulgaris]|uniref:putative lipopolysaccharide heptosyltransferase III n=1 Tax=Proteus TaxID=583 RepID=UPI000B40B40B|nr:MULTISPECIES: putative lipopolysaccharide heptosyltransferase III [Proteus]EBW1656250.1 putative lipopolysaccharide heptosyltransferase III [Salmonella enterica subsp. enterica serovar Typhimurium]RNT24905.1 putative lipopolysaccharide heptosyltransferase III [Proteus mirabilis]AYY82530.1 putative lipopolysaccharide heptosyltransferase III [Proteus vulgaris]MBG5970496.1 putative lipopolysaccharide heptosyltransferase III [Proteus vulgaris]MBG5985841.1 putative lipopolysaccharide heptosyltra
MSEKMKLIQRVLIIKLRHHGDTLLITPVINTLKANFPNAEVDILINKETKPMIEHFSSIHHIFVLDKAWKNEGKLARLRHEWKLITDLKNQQYDVVINLADQWNSAIITRFTGAKIRVGYDIYKRQSPFWKKCFTHLIPLDSVYTQHIVEQNLALLQPLQLPKIDTQVSMAYSEQDKYIVTEKLKGHKVLGSYIVIQPTSRWFFKCWDENKWSELIDALQQDGHQIVLTSGPDPREQEMVETIIKGCTSNNVVSLSGQLSLPQLAALIDHARLFIGVDSVPMHMAAALKTPLIALFGPSKLFHWSPWEHIGEVLWAGNYGELPDPDDVNTNTQTRYLSLIPVEDVLNAARGQLK